MMNEQLKEKVKEYWNKSACGTDFITKPKFTIDYFKSIEDFRYTIEPEIFSFAQFTRFNQKKILEVGIGAGTDFLQWVRSGAECYGIDLTQEAISHVTTLLAQHGLKATEVKVSDAEKIPYQDNTFDLVYSWGVIHHSPDTLKCLTELIRVTKPGGTIKVMIYNRHSLYALYMYLKYAFLKGTPFKSFSEVLFNYQESLGTKAYTTKEIKKILQSMPVSITQINTQVTNHDLLYYKKGVAKLVAYTLACIFGWQNVGWFMRIELKKHN
jgi:ubiquinone/menaquinone biosynthesis C-methylase UbiE